MRQTHTTKTLDWRSLFFCLTVCLAATALIAGPSSKASAKADSPETVTGATTVDTPKAKELHDGGAIFVDVRTMMRWEAGRIPEAVFLPIEDMSEATLSESVTKDQNVVFYCQGVKCTRSTVACEKAVSWGYKNVFYYRDGYPGWQDAGHEIE